MTEQTTFEQAWAAYEQSVQSLYAAPAGIEPEAERSVGQIYTERLEKDSSKTVANARTVRETLADHMESSDLDQRELATLKLLAAAAYDLSVAYDMLDLEKVKPEKGFQAERGGRGLVMGNADLQLVLETPMEAGMEGLLEIERAALPENPEAAKALLEKTIVTMLKAIPKGAGDLSQVAVGGLITLGIGPAQGALSVAMQEILARLPDGITMIARRAAEMVAEAIQKLHASLGEDQEKQIEEQAAKWLVDIRENADTVTALIDRLYEVEKIGTETMEALTEASKETTAEAYNQATQALEKLLEGSKKTRLTLNTVMRVLAFVKAPLLAAPPWGILAVYAAYIIIFGYSVYSGGDYLDWYRTGDKAWLDRVVGLRTVVKTSLTPPAASPAANPTPAP